MQILVPAYRNHWAMRALLEAAVTIAPRMDVEPPDDEQITLLLDRQQELVTASQTILLQAEERGGDLTAEETTTVENNTSEVERMQRQIESRRTVLRQAARLSAPTQRRTSAGAAETIDPPAEGDDPPPEPRPSQRAGARPLPNGRPRQTVAPAPRQANGNGGFHTLGHFAQSVYQSTIDGEEVDPRLRMAAATTISTEGIGADGGFAVPLDFRTNIQQQVFAEESLAGMTDPFQTTANQIVLPNDMTAPWDTTGGIQAYWESEGAARTQSKVALEPVNVRLHKLSVLVPVTEELMDDAAALTSYLNSKIPIKMDFKLSFGIAWGTGVGMPLGFMASPCLVTQGAEGGQTADTIVAANIVKMYARMPANQRMTSAWLIHPDAEPQLPLMVIGTQPVYLPPGGLSGNKYGMLLGRPVIPHQVCTTVGDVGDIMFVDLKSYIGARKQIGIKTDVSMHLWFDQDLAAFKFTLRFGGQPWWSKAVSPRVGTNTMSPFVTLAAR